VGGFATINKDHENEIRRYLFGQLREADEESLELRLLTEPEFVEEFDTVVDEVTDQYVRNELEGSERTGFEKSYLATPEGQQKVRFTSELLERATSERGSAVVTTVPEPGFFDRVRAVWQVQSLRFAAIAAAIAMIASGAYLALRPAMNYATLALSISTATRGEGPVPGRVKLESGMAGVEVNLAIPEHARDEKDYRVKLVGRESEQDLQIEKRDDQTVTVRIPASLLSPGQYAIQMSSLNPDGSYSRISGSYFFNVE
jgi:hypothetical protein